ncbi:MAG: PatB family C-S lyase [Rikenellaceae bacterium]|nr:PatB family C-S lyase [Rikenellaceae bacterium]
MYNFDQIVDREGTNCEKYDSREAIFGRADVIPLWVADTDFAVAPFITEALVRRTAHPVYGYAFRDKAYHDAIAGWVGRRHGWPIDPAWLDFSPGVVAGLVFALRAFTDPGDRVVIQPPVYPPFARVTRLNGREVVNNPLRHDGDRYTIDFDDLDHKLNGAHALLLCNPQNPTGRVFDRDELMRVGELCVRHGVTIISDDIHADLIQKPYRHIPIASLSPEIAAHTVTLIAPSKTFNIAGLSTSVIITPDDTMRRRLRIELDKMHADQGNAFGTTALIAAYNHGDQWLDEFNDYIGGNIEYVCGFLAENLPSVKCHKPEGTYLMWLDFNAWGMPHDELYQWLIDEAGLGLNDGQRFGQEGIGFMRLNLGTSRAVLEQAMRQLLDAYRRRFGK